MIWFNKKVFLYSTLIFIMVASGLGLLINILGNTDSRAVLTLRKGSNIIKVSQRDYDLTMEKNTKLGLSKENIKKTIVAYQKEILVAQSLGIEPDNLTILEEKKNYIYEKKTTIDQLNIVDIKDIYDRAVISSIGKKAKGQFSGNIILISYANNMTTPKAGANWGKLGVVQNTAKEAKKEIEYLYKKFNKNEMTFSQINEYLKSKDIFYDRQLVDNVMAINENSSSWGENFAYPEIIDQVKSNLNTGTSPVLELKIKVDPSISTNYAYGMYYFTSINKDNFIKPKLVSLEDISIAQSGVEITESNYFKR